MKIYLRIFFIISFIAVLINISIYAQPDPPPRAYCVKLITESGEYELTDFKFYNKDLSIDKPSALYRYVEVKLGALENQTISFSKIDSISFTDHLKGKIKLKSGELIEGMFTFTGFRGKYVIEEWNIDLNDEYSAKLPNLNLGRLKGIKFIRDYPDPWAEYNYYDSCATEEYKWGFFDRSIGFYKEALNYCPNNCQDENAEFYINKNIADAYMALQDYNEAIHYYYLCELIKENDIYLLLSLTIAHSAHSQMFTENYEIANSYFSKVKELDPNIANAFVKYLEGIEFQSKGHYQLALDSYNSSLKLGLQYQNLYYNIACIYSLTARSKESLQMLEECLKLGYKNFSHLLFDSDFDNIKSSNEYKTLIKRYFESASDMMNW